MKQDINTYDRQIEELFERHPSVQRQGFGGGAYKEGLDGIRAYDRALGSPWQKYPCIHVAGTNGKGSVCSMLSAALSSRGASVGLYTSPHLVDFRERMKIIRGASFLMPEKSEILSLLHRQSTEGLSFFEITTGMAFSWFADRKVDLAVIETGLGGRLDSTNIITPCLSIVTSIGLDHCDLLGDSIEKIAAEKAGIFKRGVKALVYGNDPLTAEVFRSKAAECGAELYFADHYADSRPEIGLLLESLAGKLDLQGEYQKQNLRTVLCALSLLGIKLDGDVTDAICRCARITGLHARWEQIDSSPLTICDIGHNSAALEKNFAQLRGLGRNMYIVYGVMADKDLEAIKPLMPREAKYYLAAPRISRSLDVGKLYNALEGLDRRAFPSVESAVAQAREDALKDPDAVVYIGGSNYLVAECISEYRTSNATEQI